LKKSAGNQNQNKKLTAHMPFERRHVFTEVSKGAREAIMILQTFCESRMRTAETDFDAIDRLTRLLDTCEREEKRQRQITDFFKQGQ
jgi:hypothetical protein